jgi:hypothetical protein
MACVPRSLVRSTLYSMVEKSVLAVVSSDVGNASSPDEGCQLIVPTPGGGQ